MADKQSDIRLGFLFIRQEIAAILISFANHARWISQEVVSRFETVMVIVAHFEGRAAGLCFSSTVTRFSSSSLSPNLILLQTKFRRDNIEWDKRSDGKTVREDHTKLKVEGVEVSKYNYIQDTFYLLFLTFIESNGSIDINCSVFMAAMYIEELFIVAATGFSRTHSLS